jgi:hypothetical protein
MAQVALVLYPAHEAEAHAPAPRPKKRKLDSGVEALGGIDEMHPADRVFFEAALKKEAQAKDKAKARKAKTGRARAKARTKMVGKEVRRRLRRKTCQGHSAADAQRLAAAAPPLPLPVDDTTRITKRTLPAILGMPEEVPGEQDTKEPDEDEEGLAPIIAADRDMAMHADVPTLSMAGQAVLGDTWAGLVV